MEIENNINIEKNKNVFLNNIIGKTINNALDIGLRAILPDLIENQIINIKNELLEKGKQEGYLLVSEVVEIAKECKASKAEVMAFRKEIEQEKIDLGFGDYTLGSISKESREYKSKFLQDLRENPGTCVIKEKTTN